MTIRAEREPNLAAKYEGFPYQAYALASTKDLPYAAIFHEQGLGKSKIGLDLALSWISSGIADSVIIVTKRSLIENWTQELRAHTHVEPRLLTQDRQANFLSFNSPARIYLTHYEVMKSERSRLELFLRTRKVAIILDEAHKMKNPASEVTQSLFKLASGFRRRVVMTGTPVANRPYDLWAPIFFLDGGQSLGVDFDAFRQALDLSNDMFEKSEKTDRFESQLASVFVKIRPFTVRETKLGADIQLPDKHISNVTVEMESRQAELYDRYTDEFASVLIKSGTPVLDEAEDSLKRLLRLVQVASNPKLIDESYTGIPGKFPVLSDLVDEIVERGEKVIVWTTFTSNVDWLAREFSSFHAVRIHGKLTYEQRNASINSFKHDSDCKVLVATPSSAKEGLTLTSANNAIFYDRSFSLDDYLQAQDRIHRISQTKDCSVVNLVAKHSIDEWIDKLLSAKHLAAQLIQGDINQAQYHGKADYSFGDMIKDVLGLRGTEHAPEK